MKTLVLIIWAVLLIGFTVALLISCFRDALKSQRKKMLEVTGVNNLKLSIYVSDIYWVEENSEGTRIALRSGEVLLVKEQYEQVVKILVNSGEVSRNPVGGRK